MTITATTLNTGSTTTNSAGPFTTASVTPTANQPVLLWVLWTEVSGAAPIPSVSGCGLTWSLIGQTATGNAVRTLFLFLGIGSSPTTDVVTLTGDGSTLDNCLWQMDQLAGVATAVSNGVVQSVVAKPGSATSVSVPFGSTITTGNATFGGVACAVNTTPAPGSGWSSLGSTSVASPATGLLGEFAAAGQQRITASWVGSGNAFVIGVEMAAATTGGTDATASGVVAKVTAAAPAGTVTVSGGTLTVPGAVATVSVAAPAGLVSIVTPQVTPPITLSFPAPDWFKSAVRSSYALSYTVDAFYQGTAVAGATGLRPVGGQITDTIKAGVRRNLSVELPGGKAVYDALGPTGTTLKVTANVTLTSQQQVNVPMGVFVVDQVSLDEVTGKVSVTAPDRWVLVQRAKFLGPESSSAGLSVVQQITLLIQGALGSSEAVVNLSTSSATVGALTWEKDRDKAVIDLAVGGGVWVYADRNGTFTIDDVPTISTSAAWLVDASPSGVLISLDRQKSRMSTYNVVVVDSSSSAQSLFPTQYLWDSDPASPTFAGPSGDGATKPKPELAGPFGLAPYLFSDPSIQDAGSAQGAARAILSRTVGIASQVSLTQVPNPALDAFDAMDVLPPGRVMGRRPASGGLFPGPGVWPSGSLYPDAGSPALSWVLGPDLTLERHIVDSLTHPLDPSQSVQIQGRSTRTDPYT